jgi:hypothetical protein
MGGKKYSNVLIIILALSAIFLVYRFFLKPGREEASLVGLAPANLDNDATTAATDEFLRLLLSLQSINLKNMPAVIAVLSGLEDFSTELESRDPGRENPFAPIGVGNSRPFGGRTATSTATSTLPRGTATSTGATSTRP